jgi:glycerophosphoryl diester phosphodiesterase
MSRTMKAGLCALVLAACGDTAKAPVAAPPVPEAVIPETTPRVATVSSPENASALAVYFDCVRGAGGMLIAAHRGGPAPGFPENALETLENARQAGIGVFEIDINESRDGVLFLLHDQRLNRTTTGDGYVSDMSWEGISALKLIDNEGAKTAFSPPKLTDALLWAKQNNVILELDRKETTSFRNIAAAVKAADVEDRVIFISYSDEEAGAISRAAPNSMLTAAAYGDRNIEKLRALGVKPQQLIAWTGTREPYPDAWARLREEGVEPAFGTLGRPGESLDEQFWADGKGGEYDDLAKQGLVLLATDQPFRVAGAISADDTARAACGTKR